MLARRPGRIGWLVGLLAGVAPLFVLFVAESVHSRQRSAVGADWAVLSLQVRDAEHLRLILGPYSRFRWNHPGPTFAYFLVPSFAASHGHYGGLAAGAVAVNLVAAALIVVLARCGAGRSGGSPVVATWVASVVLLAYFALFGLTYLRNPWTPLAVILPVVLVGVGGAATVSGVRWALPITVGAATFAVQTHIATLPAVGCIGAATLGAALWRHRRSLRGWLAAALWSLAVLAALWAIPVYQQLTRSPGNFAALWDYFTGSRASQHPPLGEAVRYAGVQLSLSSPTLGKWVSQSLARFPPLDGWRQVLLGLVLACTALGASWSYRTRRAFSFGLAAAAILGSVGAVVAATQVDGPLSPYLTTSSTAVGVLLLLTLAVVAVDAARARWPSWVGHRGVAVGAVAIVCAGSVALCVNAALLEPAAQANYDPEVARLTAAVEAQVRPGSHPAVLLELPGPVHGVSPPWPVLAGVANQLEGDGMAPRVLPPWTFMFGPTRRETGAETVRFVFAFPHDLRGLARHLPAGSRLLVRGRTAWLYLVPAGSGPVGPS